MSERKLRVFLCHSSHDKPVVRELYQKLNAEGWIDPWLDEEKLLPGQDWDVEIEKAVEAADAIIICLSSNSVTKEGYVQKELRSALSVALTKPEDTIFIIPLRLDNCEPPRRLQLYQYADYFPVEGREKAYGRLVTSLKLRGNSIGIYQEKIGGVIENIVETQNVASPEVISSQIMSSVEVVDYSKEPECFYILRGHDKQVNSVAFSPNGKYLASAAGGFFTGIDPVRLWYLTNGEQIRGFSCSSVLSVAFSPDGKWLGAGLAGGDETLLWNVLDGESRVRLCQGHHEKINSISFSPDGKWIVCGSDYKSRMLNLEMMFTAKSNTLNLWGLPEGTVRRIFPQNPLDEVKSVAFSPDSKCIASGSIDGMIRLWDITTGQLIKMFKGHEAAVSCVTFSPDGTQLVSTCSNDNIIRIWSVAEGNVLNLLECRSGINSVVFSPTGKILASGMQEGVVNLWDGIGGKLVAELIGHAGQVNCVAFSKDGKMLASGSHDQTIRIWRFG